MKIENLTIEVYCKRCNVVVSGSRVCLRCPHCDQIMDYIRIMIDMQENMQEDIQENIDIEVNKIEIYDKNKEVTKSNI